MVKSERKARELAWRAGRKWYEVGMFHWVNQERACCHEHRHQYDLSKGVKLDGIHSS